MVEEYYKITQALLWMHGDRKRGKTKISLFLFLVKDDILLHAPQNMVLKKALINK